ncbi:T9SS type A sorting domain-containing protein [Polaribacter haliotis]|uniref:T9SS type A sorting domain-containing protein n=1 Tax=Polaribacter haliotis TaxID=1888915 RepID=A0A7L8AG45_9FLAO|nr:T9SS type A sorting domain-containing protein [Polaribacter haliotis]QOD60981.1 T9SS type A sorting domain-containing protein [Polaribacter haliotis]
MKKTLLLLTLLSSIIGYSQFDNIPTGTGYYLNTMIPSPNTSDLTNELYEIRGTANATVPANLYLIMVEGDGESGKTDMGKVKEAILFDAYDPGNVTFGSNGILSLVANYNDVDVADTDTTNPYATQLAASNSTVLTINLIGEAGFDVTSNDSDAVASTTPNIGYDGNLTDGSATYMLISATENPKNLDIDSDNDGIIDATGDHTTKWVLYDSVSYLDYDDPVLGSETGEYGYGQTVFARSYDDNPTDFKITTSAVIVNQGNSNISYMMRQGTRTDHGLRGWAAAGNASGSVAPNWVFSGTLSKVAPDYFKDFVFSDIYIGELNPVEPTNVWNGSSSTSWNTKGNWSTNIVPDISTDVSIPSGTASTPKINSNKDAVGYTVTVDPASELYIESGGSLRVFNSFTGEVTYRVEANDTNWHLLSSPVVGAMYDGSWISTNDIDDTTGTGTNVAIATYTNGVDADGDWIYATDAANSGTFATGQGYSIKRDAMSNSYIKFTGAIKTDNLMSSITQSTNNWNLKGNPYSSYILVSDLIASNTTSLTATHKNVYVWDNNKSGGAGYDVLATTDYIHPGQGFFVNAANSDADNFIIDASKLSYQTPVTFYKSSNTGTTSIKLYITDGTKTESTDVNYLDDKTKGLDPSFDVGTFTGKESALNVFTQLVSDNEGVNFMKQALPISGIETMVIPVGVKASANKEITFSATALNLPNNLNVFIEDREKKIFTNLNDEDYTFTLDSSINGVGRFFIHTTTATVLSTENIAFEGVNIYKRNNENLTITGLQQGEVSISMFNILGKQVMSSSFKSDSNMDINLPKLAKGVYIVQLNTEKGRLNKKIILE